MENSCESTEGDGDEWNAPWGAAARTTDLTGANNKEDSFAQECSSDLPSMATSSAPSRSSTFTLSRSPPPASKLDSSECSPDHEDHRAVPDGFEVPEVRTKWYQRPVYRWISLGSILFGLAGAIVVLVVLVIRPQSAASSSSLAPPTPVATTAAPTKPDPSAAPSTPDPISSPIPGAPPTTVPIATALTTPDPTAAAPTPDPITAPPTRVPNSSPPTQEPSFLTPELIACNFLSMRYVNLCRSTLRFEGNTWSSTIPTEIGLLTQLTYMDLNYNVLTSTIPSEIGLLTQITYLNFGFNTLTSTIPTAIGLLTQLEMLSFAHNSLTSTIPTEIGLLSQLSWLDFSSNNLKGSLPSLLCPRDVYLFIIVDCFEITCVSGCCRDQYEDSSLCS